MPYEADPAGLGIGHRYGPRNLGGVAGVYRGDGAEREYIWELMAGEVDATPALTLVLPANYLVESVYYEVEEAFAAGSTANLSIDGGAGLTAAISLATAVPLTEAAVAGLANLSGDENVPIVLTVNTAGIDSATGNARVMVRFKAI